MKSKTKKMFEGFYETLSKNEKEKVNFPEHFKDLTKEQNRFIVDLLQEAVYNFGYDEKEI